MKREVALFYPLVVLITGIDMAFMIGLFWSSLKITGSPLALGVVLCLSVLLPFTLQRLSRRSSKAFSPGFRQTLLLRLMGFAVIFVTISLYANILQGLAGFVFVALIVGVLGFFTTSVLEALNTRFSLSSGMNSEHAARWMQTATQIGAFGGAALGGFVLEKINVNLFAQSFATIGALVAMVALLLPLGHAKAAIEKAKDIVAVNHDTVISIDGKLLKGLCLALGMIGFHIGTFNTLTPVIYQNLHHWTSADFGMASATAGCGAFLAAILPRLQIPEYVAALGMLLMDLLLVFSPIPLISIAACFGIGYCINYLRIGLRKQLIDLSRTPADADRIAAVSAFYYLLMQSAAPLLLSALVTQRVFGENVAPYLFACVPLVLLCCMLILPRLVGATQASISEASQLP